MWLLIIQIWFLLTLLQCEAQFDNNEYAVEMDMDDLEANLDLSAYNIEVVRKVSALGNVYHLRHSHSCKSARCKRDTSDSIINVLRMHPLIHRVEEQVDLEVEQKSNDSEFEYFYDDQDLDLNKQKLVLKSLEDDLIKDMDVDTEMVKKSFTKQSELKTKTTVKEKESVKTVQKKYHEEDTKELSKDDKEYRELVRERQKRFRDLHFNDPKTSSLWQYNNFGQFDQINPGLDMNLFNLYKVNITGRGIVVTVIDDGIDTIHDEIKRNFDPAASLDLNDPRNIKSNPRGPSYRERIPFQEGHGTMCGSTISGEANNEICAFGVAYNSNLGGIRMLAQNMVTDLLEAYALTHNNQYIDIYSNSWGPKDNGMKTSPVTYYVKKALEIGTRKGRGGRGSIYLFAAGNGGVRDDHCGGDGFVNSPFTISVTSTNIYGRKPIYTEECSAISITAPVGGQTAGMSIDERKIDPRLISSEVNNRCGKGFVGTSAATPLVAGCIALALETNNNLNWRDIQHLFSVSGRIPNTAEHVWQLNSAGFLLSHIYGFGLLDCTAFVRNAQMWNNVGELRVCVAGETNFQKEIRITSRKKTRITFSTRACENTENSIQTLEHVIVNTKIQHVCRGDLILVLTSPSNTKSILLKNRINDRNDRTVSFSFLSLMNWGEDPRGVWHLDVIDLGECQEGEPRNTRGYLLKVVLQFYGTSSSDSAFSRNRHIFDSYFKSIKIPKIEKSVILNENHINEYFNNQRKHFIQLKSLHKEVIKQKKILEDNRDSEENIHKIRDNIYQLKDTIADDEMMFLNNLLRNINMHNTSIV